jgi:hypothetical protein
MCQLAGETVKRTTRTLAQCIVKLQTLKGNTKELRFSLMAGEFLANRNVVN